MKLVNTQEYVSMLRELTLGDSQQNSEIEGPIEESQIFALITSVCRKGRWIGPGNFWWEFFEHDWIRLIPFRRFLINTYRFMSSIRR